MIPLMRPTLPENKALILADLERMMESGQLTRGPFCQRLKEAVSRDQGVPHVSLAPSNTLGLMALLSTLPKGSEVILPAFTFCVTYQMIEWNGLVPVVVDITADGPNLDPAGVEDAITEKTSAILGVHICGIPCCVEDLERLAEQYGIKLFFDAAHAYGSKVWVSDVSTYPIGRFGDASVFSLGPTKLLPAGEGGIVVTNDKAIAAAVDNFLNHSLYQYEDNFDVDGLGVNGRMPEAVAILAYHVVADVDKWVQRRQVLRELYVNELSDVPGLTMLRCPDRYLPTWKDVTIYVDPEKYGRDRNQLRKLLADGGIQTKPYFYPPVHRLREFKARGREVRQPVPNAERQADTVLALPFWSHMESATITEVCEAIRSLQA